MVKSSIGCKAVMAGTGLALFGFVVAHMLGNLQVFAGPEVYNHYAHAMQSLGPILWAARLGLLAIVAAHIATAVWLTRKNREARPERYVFDNTVQASYASRSMFMTGLIVLAFILYHLMHFTLKTTGAPGDGLTYRLHDGTEVPDVYSFFVTSFRVWYIVLVYLVAQVLLAIHLSHGVSSMFQTVGWKGPKYAAAIDNLGPALAIAILLGNVSMPIACFSRLLRLPSELSTGGML